jgi:CRP-like cAMP-binding protein
MVLAHPNHFVRCLPGSERALLEPNLQTVELNTGAVLQRVDEPITHAYFPRSGILSLVVSFSDGATVQAALAGSNTLLGGVAALGGDIALATLTVQIAGMADRIAVDDLKRVADQNHRIRLHLRQHVHALFGQAIQIGACNAIHSVEERLCRSLLQCRDLMQTNSLPLTHEFLAAMLGVRRTSVTLVLGHLQHAGLTGSRRGSIELLDLRGLSDAACECYEVIRAKVQHSTGWAPEILDRTCV